MGAGSIWTSVQQRPKPGQPLPALLLVVCGWLALLAVPIDHGLRQLFQKTAGHAVFDLAGALDAL